MVDVVPPPPGDRVEPVGLEVEMQRSFLDYAMSVIVARALPDVRDGLKPVHRRVLYAMYDGGYRPDRGYYKCSPGRRRRDGHLPPRTVTARSTTPSCAWRSRGRCAMPLVDGQGNFGSPGNDPPAAMRYTECRLESARDGDAPRHRPGHRRLPSRTTTGARPGAGCPAEPVPQPARQRRQPASPSAWPPTSRRTTCAKSTRVSSGSLEPTHEATDGGAAGPR